jgi:hypothetical protein
VEAEKTRLTAKVGLCRVCGLLADFDNSLMPDGVQDFVKVVGYFSRGGRSMLCSLRL